MNHKFGSRCIDCVHVGFEDGGYVCNLTGCLLSNEVCGEFIDETAAFIQELLDSEEVYYDY